MKYEILCKYCNTPTVIKRSSIFFRCMCDEDVRSIPVYKIDENFINDNVYLYFYKNEDGIKL